MKRGRKSAEKALFGSVAMLQKKCPNCKCVSFIIDGKFSCCDELCEEPETITLKRISAAESRRSVLSKKVKDAILEQQNNCCIYCNRPLWGYEYNRETNKRRKVKTHFDHLVPWSFSGNNDEINIVAACERCNLIKSDMYFATLDQAKLYIIRKRENDKWK